MKQTVTVELTLDQIHFIQECVMEEEETYPVIVNQIMDTFRRL